MFQTWTFLIPSYQLELSTNSLVAEEPVETRPKSNTKWVFDICDRAQVLLALFPAAHL